MKENRARAPSWIVLLLLAGGLVHGQGTTTAPLRQAEGRAGATWSLEFGNDVFFGSDNHLTNSLALKKHSTEAASWDDLAGLPRFLCHLGRHLPTLSGAGLTHRASLAIGQVMQTPDDLGRIDPIREDVPYAGVISLQASWVAYNDNELRGVSLMTGILGPPSLAGQIQKAFHRLIHSTVPQGWHNQLGSEWLLNLHAVRKVKIGRSGSPSGVSWDTAVSGDAGLGNLLTQASVALEMRMGDNMPRGFAPAPDLVGFAGSHLALMLPERPDAPSFYGSLTIRGTLLAHTALLDGNTFRDSPRIGHRAFLGQLVAGLHYENQRWGARLFVVSSTPAVDTPRPRPGRGGADQICTINVEWRH